MLARIWDKSLEVVVATSYAVIVVVGFAQVLFRFVFESPLSWSEELVRYVFIWSVFLTAAIGFNLNSHISIDFLTTWYPPRLQRMVALVSWGCVKGDAVPAREYTWPNTKAPWSIRLPRGRIGASQASSSTLDIVPVFRPPCSPSPSRRHGSPGGWKYDITAIGEVKSIEPHGHGKVVDLSYRMKVLA
jgi:hypothetical protein